MAQARRQFLQARRAAEVTWGTPVTPMTAILAGLNTIRWRPAFTVVQATKLDGSLAAANSAEVTAKHGELYLAGYVTPEDFPYVLESAYATASPSADAGTPIAYTRVYAPALITENVPKSATIEVGGNVQQWRIPGAVVQNFELSGRIGDYAMFTSNWWGKDLVNVPGGFTGTLTKRSVERLKSKNFKFYIDAASGTIGTTQVTDCITSWSFRSGDCYLRRNCHDGTLNPAGYSQADQRSEMTLTFQVGTQTKALYDYLEAGTLLYIRMVCEGTNIHGTPTINKKFQVDMCAAITEFPETGDNEEENALAIPITFMGTEDQVGTWAKLVEYTDVNKVATLV
jgi:hypothetical protein